MNEADGLPGPRRFDVKERRGLERSRWGSAGRGATGAEARDVHAGDARQHVLRGHRIGPDAAVGLSPEDAARAGGHVASEVRPVTATEKRWRARVAAWARSGLSCKEYAA